MTLLHDPDLTVAPPRLTGIDHLEWWVGNARTFAGFLCSAFGFEPVAYAGPRDRAGRPGVATCCARASMRFMVSGALHPDSPIAEHVRRHGDGIRDVAFLVDDVDAAYDAALQRGRHRAATARRRHRRRTAPSATRRSRPTATPCTRSSTAAATTGPFAPGFEASDLPVPVGPEVGLVALDHVVGNVELGALERWVHFYEQVFGFCQLMHFDDDQISTEYSALMSTVVWSGEAPGAPAQPRPS